MVCDGRTDHQVRRSQRGDQDPRGRWKKDVKQVKLSDVQMTSVVLGWDNRSDDTLANVGTLKAGGQTAAKDAPGRKGRLKSVKIQYKILGKAPTATVKIWGLD
jgi:hypothetical protein